MGVQTQIDRLETAKNDIIVALLGKGVTVPGSTKLDDIAALIDSIVTGGSSGGGLPDGFSNLTGGTITPASDTSDSGLNYLEHDLGTAPNFYIVTMNCPVSPADHAGYVVAIACFKCKIGNTETLGIYFRPSANGNISQATMNYPGMGNIMFADTQIAYFGSLKAGVEYAWMCGVIEGLA